MVDPLAVSIVVTATVIGAFGSLLLKTGSSRVNLNPFDQIKNWRLILGIFLYGISAIMFIVALKRGDLSVLYPITSLSYVWIAFLSNKFLGEKINSFKIIGTILIVMGVILIAQ